MHSSLVISALPVGTQVLIRTTVVLQLVSSCLLLTLRSSASGVNEQTNFAADVEVHKGRGAGARYRTEFVLCGGQIVCLMDRYLTQACTVIIDRAGGVFRHQHAVTVMG